MKQSENFMELKFPSRSANEAFARAAVASFAAQLDLTVRDRGVGILDVAQASRPMFTTGGAERSGMGFTIMESFMSEFRITSTPGKGTTVHMKRKIVCRGGAR